MSASPAPAAPQRREEEGWCSGDAWPFLAFTLFAVVILVPGSQEAEPVYRVAIDAVSGLDPATDLARPTLAPGFNLTVRVDAESRGDACLDPGSAAAVSYRGVPLAAGAALPSKLCGKSGGVALVASSPRGAACACRGPRWTSSRGTCGPARRSVRGRAHGPVRRQAEGGVLQGEGWGRGRRRAAGPVRGVRGGQRRAGATARSRPDRYSG
ncbi:hypothetical protein ACP4OV_006243 [Aristida adscensionis]